MSAALLQAEGIAKHYPLKAAGFSSRKGRVLAVQDVSLEVAADQASPPSAGCCCASRSPRRVAWCSTARTSRASTGRG